MRLLVRTPNWLGDAVMSLSAVGGILDSEPDAALWAHRRVVELYQIIFPERQVHQFPGLPEGHSYESLLLMPGSFSSALAGVKAGIGRITGVPGDARTPLLWEVRRIPEDRTRHHSLHYEALAETVGAAPLPPRPPKLAPIGERHVAFFAGARYGEAKVWRGFQEVAASLEENCVFYGTPQEREYLLGLADPVGASVCTGISMAELCGRLMRACAAVGNDSGGVHLSAFLGVPTVSIFGSTSPAWTAPISTGKSLVIGGEAPCSPCFRRECAMEGPLCLGNIKPALVTEAVERLIDGR